MAIRPISIFGSPVLHQPAREVSAVTSEITRLIDDLFDTVRAAPGVGLAAPQIGVPLRVFVYAYQNDDGSPWRGALINPTLYITPPPGGEPDEETESEGCLSFPGERFPLHRGEHVLAEGLGADGEPVAIRASGWKARIIQHEYDHLNGMLYLDRLDSQYDRTVSRIVRKKRWGAPGTSWDPTRQHLD